MKALKLQPAYLVDGTKIVKGFGFEIPTYYFSRPNVNRKYFRTKKDESFKISRSGLSSHTIVFDEKQAQRIAKNRKDILKIEKQLEKPKIQGKERKILEQKLSDLKSN